MKHYLFLDGETGEYYIVGADDLDEAYDISNEYFTHGRYTGDIWSDFEAECSGLDEY